jgi:hypothetical protein
MHKISHADLRVTNAREYLAGVRQHKVSALPPSVLLREVAELRRQLGQVLDAIDQAEDEIQGSRTASGTDPDGMTTIVPPDLPAVLGALADAAGCHERHLSRPEVAAAYRSLARQLDDGR